MSKGRLLIVTHYWPPHVGGIETVAVEQARRLAERGWDVRVATSRLAGDRALERFGPILVERFRCLNALEGGFNVPVPLMSPAMLTALWRRSSEVDVVVAHGHVYVGTLFAAVVARRTRTPLVLVQHSPFVDYGFALNILERIADRTLGRWVIRSAEAVIVVSEFTASFVRSLAPDVPTVIVRSGIDRARYSPCRRTSQRTRPVVLTVRRLVPRNGVDVLVNAWQFARLGDRADLSIAGSGPEATRIRNMADADPSIRLIGYVPDDALPSLYRNADVFVLPSKSGEGFGLVVLEAMASGLPVIATKSGGVIDLVADGVNGRLVPPNDARALARALSELVDVADLRGGLRQGALESVSSISWDTSIDLLEETLVKVIST
jgi:glycosyltransferase involved in cell wall biosynthesis